jgi:hypothetical protein
MKSATWNIAAPDGCQEISHLEQAKHELEIQCRTDAEKRIIMTNIPELMALHALQKVQAAAAMTRQEDES